MIIQGSPEILDGPKGLNGHLGVTTQVFTEAQLAIIAAKQAKKDAAHQASLQRLYPGVDTKNPNAVNAARAAAAEAKRQELLRLKEIKAAELAVSRAAAIKAEVDASEYAKYLAVEANAAVFAAAEKKVINEAWVVANRAAVNSENAVVFEDQLAKATLREQAITAIKAIYLEVLGREGDAAGIKYFADRFGDVVDPDELQIFRNMAQIELDARNIYIAEMAAKSAQDSAAAAATAAAATKAAADAAAIEAANQKTVADAYAAAQAAAAAAAATTTLTAKQAAEALRARALAAVKALYLQVLGREGDAAGLNYFADRFGDVIDPDELQIFSDMSKPEIDARNQYLADMAAKSKEDAAKAKALADSIAAAADKAKADAAAAVQTAVQVVKENETGSAGGGINPMLILAAAAAAFFIGG